MQKTHCRQVDLYNLAIGEMRIGVWLVKCEVIINVMRSGSFWMNLKPSQRQDVKELTNPQGNRTQLRDL